MVVRVVTRKVVLSRDRLWFCPASAAGFFMSAMRQAVAAIARFTVIGCHHSVQLGDLMKNDRYWPIANAGAAGPV